MGSGIREVVGGRDGTGDRKASMVTKLLLHTLTEAVATSTHKQATPRTWVYHHPHPDCYIYSSFAKCHLGRLGYFF